VRNGYVTRERAREIYRVAIDAVDGDYVLNLTATAALRTK